MLTRTTWPTRRTMYSGIVGAIWIGADAAALVLAHLVLVDDPLQRAAVAQAVVEDLRRDAAQCERVIDLQRRFVFRQPHFLDMVGERHAGRFDPFQRPRFQLLIVQVQPGQLLAGLGESPEVGGQRNTGQFAFQVLGEPLAVARMMQNSVDVIEDIPLRDLLVPIVFAEVLQGPIRDVLAAVRAVLVVDVEGETLMSVNTRTKMNIRQAVRCQRAERACAIPDIAHRDRDVVALHGHRREQSGPFGSAARPAIRQRTAVGE